MVCLLSIFGETPFFELVRVLTATKKLLTHTPAVNETSSHVDRYNIYTHVGAKPCFSFIKAMRSSSDIA